MKEERADGFKKVDGHVDGIETAANRLERPMVVSMFRGSGRSRKVPNTWATR